MTRTLRLRKETLVELSTAELTQVAGAAATLKDPCTGGPTLSLFCASAYDGCITGRGCTR